ncbi:MAG TPA: NAD-dependent epimerase [Hyphomicrobium sp.]|nr:NAD-dependent epimerase [Hyphomicrobium sp.]
MKPVLVTGAAGFIGFHVAKTLLERGRPVIGIDNINDYYDTSLKLSRLDVLRKLAGFEFQKIDIADRAALSAAFEQAQPEFVIHLAAQAGVRYSLENPHAYIEANLAGFANILEGCRLTGVRHLTYASSSSVYGANTAMPFSVHHNVDHPLSLYAASKKANELMAHCYSHLYRLPTTGLRFFTVYGPWGRPDMAMFLFTKAILEGRPIDVFNNGEMKRDFTYIDDIVEGVIRTSDTIAAPNPSWSGSAPDSATSRAPYRIYNIGNNTPVELMRVISIIERELGREAKKTFLPLQPGDVPETYADVDALVESVGFQPKTPIEVGIQQFISWYRDYYSV